MFSISLPNEICRSVSISPLQPFPLSCTPSKWRAEKIPVSPPMPSLLHPALSFPLKTGPASWGNLSDSTLLSSTPPTSLGYWLYSTNPSSNPITSHNLQISACWYNNMMRLISSEITTCFSKCIVRYIWEFSDRATQYNEQISLFCANELHLSYW